MTSEKKKKKRNEAAVPKLSLLRGKREKVGLGAVVRPFPVPLVVCVCVVRALGLDARRCTSVRGAQLVRARRLGCASTRAKQQRFYEPTSSLPPSCKGDLINQGL